jgi:hypothetical protein
VQLVVVPGLAPQLVGLLGLEPQLPPRGPEPQLGVAWESLSAPASA